ncbi:MAG: hypothetical protein WCC37_08900, partial [Candidatus Sulfotelmatobacter sp.]
PLSSAQTRTASLCFSQMLNNRIPSNPRGLLTARYEAFYAQRAKNSEVSQFAMCSRRMNIR